jgi:hypothetical protein
LEDNQFHEDDVISRLHFLKSATMAIQRRDVFNRPVHNPLRRARSTISARRFCNHRIAKWRRIFASSRERRVCASNDPMHQQSTLP